MAALSTDQRTDIQGDLGITDDESVFTNDELDRLYTRADSDYNTAVYLAWRQLMADSSKFFDYTAGQTTVKKSQVRKHIAEMVEFWKAEATTRSKQVAIVGMNLIPPKWKDEPIEPGFKQMRKDGPNG